MILLKPVGEIFVRILDIIHDKLQGLSRVIKLNNFSLKVTYRGFLYIFLKKNIYFEYLNLHNLLKNIHNLQKYFIGDLHYHYELINIQFSLALFHTSTYNLINQLSTSDKS